MAGASLGWAHGTQRDDASYFTTSNERFETDSFAVDLGRELWRRFPTGVVTRMMGTRRTTAVTTDEDTYETYAAELTRYAAAIAGPIDADDIVAEAFMSVLTSPKWPTVEDRRAYLYRVVLNQVRDRHRSRSRRERRELAAREDAAAADMAIRPEVLAVMRSLTTRQCAVLFCIYWLDLEVTSTADRLALSTRTVQREAHTARNLMKALL